VGISLSFLNQLTPYSIILKRNKIIFHHIHSDIPFFGGGYRTNIIHKLDVGYKKVGATIFSKYSQFDILRHVISRFVGRAYEWCQKRQVRVEKGRASCINTFYELKACMWKHFVPSSFRITRE